MSVEERALHELHTGLEEVIGPERAATLMSRLSPVASTEVVTKSYFDEKLSAVEGRLMLAIDTKLAAVDTKLAAVDTKLATVDIKLANLEATLLRQMNSQTRTMIFSLIMALAMVTALLVGIR